MNRNIFFSFGGGVQSTAIALLLINSPEKFTDIGLELPYTVIFADTGAEPPKLYPHVEKILGMLSEKGFNCQVVKKGEPIHRTKRGLSTVPWFTSSNNNEIGMLKRQCTNEYKIQPIYSYIKEFLGFKKGERKPANIANIWVGISTDESVRAKPSPDKWINRVHPLIEIGWNRLDCAIYGFSQLGYQVPKSACFFCPYTHPQEWTNRKQLDPNLFEMAKKVDEEIRNLPAFGKTKQPCFIHPKGIPLEEVSNQMTLDFLAGFYRDCTGTCGV